jgi:hypothetical protein
LASVAVGEEADPGLQQRGGDLEGQGDHADLGEAQVVVGLEHGVDRRQHRLDQVVDQVRQAQKPMMRITSGVAWLAVAAVDAVEALLVAICLNLRPQVWDPIIGKQIDT